MIFPLLSMEATGSSRPILIRAVPSSYPRATLQGGTSLNHNNHSNDDSIVVTRTKIMITTMMMMMMMMMITIVVTLG